MTRMTSIKRLARPKIKVTGEVDGRTVVMEATARSVEISDHCEVDDFLDSTSTLDAVNTTTLSAELEGSWEMSMRDEVTYEVFHSATTEATDRSVEALEKARRAIGAPENAKVSLGHNTFRSDELVIENLDEPRPVSVEFRWREQVSQDKE